MKRFGCLFLAFVGLAGFNEVMLASETKSPTKSSQDEQELWEPERSYWRYIEANDLVTYRNLWHNDFSAGHRSALRPFTKIILPTGLLLKPAKD